jgi:hypothetical protein
MTTYKRLEKGSNGTLWALLADGTYQEARFCFNYFCGSEPAGCNKVFIVSDNDHLPPAHKEFCSFCATAAQLAAQQLNNIYNSSSS